MEFLVHSFSIIPWRTHKTSVVKIYMISIFFFIDKIAYIKYR